MNTTTDARSLDVKGLEDLRRRAVAAVVERGRSKAEVARLFGVSRTSVHHWVKLYRRRGEAGLTPKRPGRAKQSGRLKGWQAATVVNMITDRCPDQLKLPFALWTREAVGELIEQRFGIRYSVWTVGRLLRRWGFSPQKPVRRAYERDDKKIKRWLDEKYPAIRQRAKRENAGIYWGDQMGLRSDCQSGRSYGRRGRTPITRGTGKRFSCNMMSTITNQGRLAFMVFKGRFTADVMIQFLERLIRHVPRKAFLILDGHPVHRAKKVQTWLSEHKEQIEVFTLPPYSPELNPDELLNQDVKSNALKHHRPHNQTEMIDGLRRYLRSTQGRPDVVRAYFQEPHVLYAAE